MGNFNGATALEVGQLYSWDNFRVRHIYGQNIFWVGGTASEWNIFIGGISLGMGQVY